MKRTEIKKMSKDEAQTEWHDHLYSKGVHKSLCVQGLLHRLEKYECTNVEVKKYDDKVRVNCTVEDNNRNTYWEANFFIIQPSVLINKDLEGVDVAKASTIVCIDTIQTVNAYQYTEEPRLEKVELKK